MAIPMPGPYEVPQIIQQILQKRREEARQAMVDKLQMDTQNRQLDISQGHLDVAKAGEDRARKMDEAQQGEIKERVTASQIGSMGEAEQELSPEWKAANPELYQELIKRRRIRQDTITPKTGSSTEFQVPQGASPEQIEAFAKMMEGQQAQDLAAAGPSQTREMFTGSPEFQRSEIARNRLTDYMSGLKDNDPMRQVGAAQLAGLQGVGVEDVRPTRHVFMSPEGKYGPVREFPAGTSVTEGNWSPAAYQPGVQFLGTTPEGIGKFMTNRVGQDGLPVIMEVPGIGTIQRPGTPDQTPDTGLQTAINNLRITAGTQGARRDEALPAARAAILAAASRMLTPAGQTALMDAVNSFTAGTRLPTQADVPAAMAINRQKFPTVPEPERQVIETALTGYLSVPLE